jgi:hypothetical protein
MAAFVTVAVEPHDALPEGAVARWKVAGPARAVTRVEYTSDDGLEGHWQVWACDAEGALRSAEAVLVDDSSAGLSWLIHGGTHGLRLQHDATGERVAEAYVLLADEADLG